MKKLVFVLIMLACAINMQAGDNQKQRVHFCVVHFILESPSKYSAYIDFGDSEKCVIVKNDKKLKGGLAIFLNIMEENGWKYIDTYAFSNEDLPSIIYSKKITSEDDIKKGIELKAD